MLVNTKADSLQVGIFWNVSKISWIQNKQSNPFRISLIFQFDIWSFYYYSFFYSFFYFIIFFLFEGNLAWKREGF